MKALLIDVDSKIPNLALMQLSTYLKGEGYGVQLVKFKDMKGPIEADAVFASIVFKWNRDKGYKILDWYPFVHVDIGGSGWDVKKSLPACVTTQTPDYSIYPDCDYDLGFTSRGCIRNCYFCIVREKEGSWHKWQHPAYFHVPEHKKVMLLDNNILANKTWFRTVADWLIENDLRVDFNQGLDIRLLDYPTARILKRLKPIRCWRFAFDDMSYKDDVIRGLNMLKLANISVRNNVIFYVYVNDDSQFEDALERCQILREAGTLPFIMMNKDSERTQRIRDLARWCRPWVFFKHTFEEYDRTMSHVKERGKNAGC